MCKARPYPRCSDHATKALKQSITEFEAHPSPENEVKLAEAREDYAISRIGVLEIREAGEAAISSGNIAEGVRLAEQADANEAKRHELIAKADRETYLRDRFIPSVVATLKRYWETYLARSSWSEGNGDTLLSRLSESDDWQVRGAVANNTATPPEVLVKLARDHDPRVRAALAISYGAHSRNEALAILADDEDETVRISVALQQQTPPEALRKLAHGASIEVVESLALNPSTPADVLQSFESTQAPAVQVALASNPSSPVSTLTKLRKSAQMDVREALAYNPSTPAKMLTGLYVDEKRNKRPLNFKVYDSAQLKENLAWNPNTPNSLLQRLSKSKYPSVRKAARYNIHARAE